MATAQATRVLRTNRWLVMCCLREVEGKSPPGRGAVLGEAEARYGPAPAGEHGANPEAAASFPLSTQAPRTRHGTDDGLSLLWPRWRGRRMTGFVHVLRRRPAADASPF